MLISSPLPHCASVVSTLRRVGTCFASLALAGSSALGAAPQNLNTLKFTEVVDKVVVIDAVTQRSRPASVNQTFKVPDQISTGANSRAELVAPDGTVTRVGANTVFSFAADKRQVNLQKGSILFHSPEGKGGGVIASDGAQAAVMGTTLIVTATANKGFKLLVLEGKAKATLPGGNSMAVTAGQLTVVAPGKSDFGPVLNFRLKEQVAGSALVKGFRTPIASERKVLDSVERQERMIASGRAESTNMRVRGDQLMQENGPPPLNKNELQPPRPTEEAKGIISSIPTDLLIRAALQQDVSVLGKLGSEPGSSLFGSGENRLTLSKMFSRLSVPSGTIYPPSLSSIFGGDTYFGLLYTQGNNDARLLLAQNLTLTGLDHSADPTASPVDHFPYGGNLAEFLFPNLLIDVKIVAASGAVSINDNRTEDVLNPSNLTLSVQPITRSPTGPPQPQVNTELKDFVAELAQQTATDILSRLSEIDTLRSDSTKTLSEIVSLNTEYNSLEAQLNLLAAQGPAATEKLFWVLGRSVTMVNTFLKAKSESLALGTYDPSINSPTLLGNSIVFNRSGSVDVRGASIIAANTSIYARGNISLSSLSSISLVNTWSREISAPYNSINIVATGTNPNPRSAGNLTFQGVTATLTPTDTIPGVINIVGASIESVTTLSAKSISLDARTIVLKNVDFAAGSKVVLASNNGQLAPNPNTGATPTPLYVNFVSGVKYGGTPIPTTATTATLPSNITLRANNR